MMMLHVADPARIKPCSQRKRLTVSIMPSQHEKGRFKIGSCIEHVEQSDQQLRPMRHAVGHLRHCSPVKDLRGLPPSRDYRRWALDIWHNSESLRNLELRSTQEPTATPSERPLLRKSKVKSAGRPERAPRSRSTLQQLSHEIASTPPGARIPLQRRNSSLRHAVRLKRVTGGSSKVWWSTMHSTLPGVNGSFP